MWSICLSALEGKLLRSGVNIINMKKSSCELLQKYYPKISEVEELRSTYIANCALKNLLCCTAIMLNIVTIHAIRKTSSLPKTLKTLLLSLAISDAGVGLLGQPIYTALLVKRLQENNTSCCTYMVFDIMISLFSTASVLGVVVITVDRFLAIHLHLIYQEILAYKRVVAVVILTVGLSVFLSLLILWIPPDINSIIAITFGVVGLLLTKLVYISIFLAVRRHKNQIQALQVQQVAQTDEMAIFASLIKSTVGIFSVYMMFLICYLPLFICLAAIKSANNPSVALKRFFLFSYTLMFLNSSLNPVVYCWKMRHIRHAVIDTLRNMFLNRNHPSHLW